MSCSVSEYEAGTLVEFQGDAIEVSAVVEPVGAGPAR